MRYASLGNGRLYLGWDGTCRLREMFWPVVGLANHLQESLRSGFVVWHEGRFMDLGGPDFLTVGRYLPGMGFLWHFRHKSIPLELRVTDYVDPYLPVWSRTVEVHGEGHGSGPRIAVHSVDSYALGENTVGEQAAWNESGGRLYHFKGRVWTAAQFRVLGADGRPSGDAPASQGAVAKVRDGGVRFSDATGEAMGQAVDHGLIQSAIGGRIAAAAGERAEFLLAFGSDRAAADSNLDKAGPGARIEARSRNYWRGLRVTGTEGEVPGAGSVKVLATHCGHEGGVIASCDTDILGDYRDHYRYVWPRDAAMCASALLRAGFPGYAHRYLGFCCRALSPGGFFWQRYRPDATRGSGWHPWGLPPGELPIQEDETGLSLVTAGDFLDLTGDLESLHSFYTTFVQRAARFLLDYRTCDGLLVKPSFDLWEERRGIFSFTQAACAGGLLAASRIASALGLEDDSRDFDEGAGALLSGLALHLSSEDKGFCRSLTGLSDGDCRFDKDWTDDASLLMIPLLLPGVTAPAGLGDSTLQALRGRCATTWRRLRSTLAVHLPGAAVPGYARYAGDWYQRPANALGAPGNPWLVTTAWFALSGVRLGLIDAAGLKSYLDWFDSVTGESGMMPEQVSATTGEMLSVAPLAWSHAMYLELLTAARTSPALIPPLPAGKDTRDRPGGDSL